MTKFRYKHIQSTVEDRKPSNLLDGEIAVNRFAGKEKLFLKNASGDVVSFSSDSAIDGKLAEKLNVSDFNTYSGAVNTTINSKAAQSDLNTLSGTVTAHTASTNIHLSATEKTNIDSLATNIAAISGVTSTKVGNWDTAYGKVSGITASTTAINSLTGSVGTMAYENKTSYYTSSSVDTLLAGKSDIGHTHDDRYYIKSDVDDKITAISGSSTGSASKTITAVTQNGGVVTPTYANISITKSQVSDFPSSMTPTAHTHKSNEINGMSGYTKPSSTSAIATGDTLNQAIGKLEKALDGKQPSGNYVTNATYTAYTAATDTAISNKAAKASAFTNAVYDSEDKKIYFKNEDGTNVANIDATDFIKDGMIESVELQSKSGTTYIVITWNTDAGSQVTELNIGDAFEADNYYTKNDLTGTTTTVKVKNASVADSANAVALSNVSGADDLKAIEALTGTSGILKKTSANTWSLDTTSYSSATQVSTALGNKVDKVSGKGLSTNDFTNTEKTNLDSLATNIATISGITSTKVSNWNTAYSNSHTHSNKSYLDGITGAIGTAAYKAEGYFAGSGHTHPAYVNQNAFSNVKVGTTTVAADSATDTIELVGDGIITITPDATNDKITISASNAVTSVAGKTGAVTLVKGDVGLGNVDNTADANKKVASAATAAVAESVALSNVTDADDLKAIEALAGTSGILKKTAANTWSLDTTSYSSATQVNTALGNKSNTGHTHDDRYFTETEITNKIAAMSASTSGSAAKTITALSESNGVISATYANISITKSQISDFAHNQASNTITAMTGYAKASTAAAIASGDTLNAAIGKLEKALDGKQPSGSYVTTGRTISTASGLTGGGNLSTNRTFGLEAVTVGNYNGSSVTTNMVSYDTYGRVSSAAPVIYSAVTINKNTSNVTCPDNITGASKSGAQAIVLYVNNGSTSNYTVTVSTSYKSPDGGQISLICPKNGYAEVNYINIGGVIYARGL